MSNTQFEHNVAVLNGLFRPAFKAVEASATEQGFWGMSSDDVFREDGTMAFTFQAYHGKRDFEIVAETTVEGGYILVNGSERLPQDATTYRVINAQRRKVQSPEVDDLIRAFEVLLKDLLNPK